VKGIEQNSKTKDRIILQQTKDFYRKSKKLIRINNLEGSLGLVGEVEKEYLCLSLAWNLGRASLNKERRSIFYSIEADALSATSRLGEKMVNLGRRIDHITEMATDKMFQDKEQFMSSNFENISIFTSIDTATNRVSLIEYSIDNDMTKDGFKLLITRFYNEISDKREELKNEI
jgi:hypothetical protein